MDYTDSGFRAGFRRGLRVAWDAMRFRPLRHEPWPSPPMPSLRDHLEAYGGTRMSPADFDRCETDWYRMLDERNRMFDRRMPVVAGIPDSRGSHQSLPFRLLRSRQSSIARSTSHMRGSPTRASCSISVMRPLLPSDSRLRHGRDTCNAVAWIRVWAGSPPNARLWPFSTGSAMPHTHPTPRPTSIRRHGVHGRDRHARHVVGQRETALHMLGADIHR